MLLNLFLFLISLFFIVLLFRKIRKPTYQYTNILPDCKFNISKPKFKRNNGQRIAQFNVFSKNKNIYFRDFPLGFKFYSTQKFKSKIKITYTCVGDDEVEVIYDRIVEFEDHKREHIYYINDVIIGGITIEIYTDIIYGKPIIEFEILQNNLCHMTKEYKLEIVFPD